MIPTPFQRCSSPLPPMSSFWLKMWKLLTSFFKLSPSFRVYCSIHAPIPSCLILSRILFIFIISLSTSNILHLSSIAHRHILWVFLKYIISACSNWPDPLGRWVFTLTFSTPRYACLLIVVDWLWLDFSLQIIIVADFSLLIFCVVPSIARLLPLAMVMCISPAVSESSLTILFLLGCSVF